MKVYVCKLQFNTPAFLGDAKQNGAWRTPPIKALLRQFWRMDYAADNDWNVDTETMREAEGKLFGVAADGKSSKSKLRIRLDRWDEGKLRSWSGLEQAPITSGDGKSKVGPHAYLGYGPLDGRGGTQFGDKCNAAIQASESATLRIAVPDIYGDQIGRALALADRFGALGGRSRNGWGSFSLTPLEHSAATGFPMRDWCEALTLDWPHAIGSDNDAALIWRSQPHTNWESLMRTLAEVKLGLRTTFVFSKREIVEQPEDRHWLAYPVTKHAVKSWKDNNARLPNSLRFKVRKDDDGKLYGLIFHVPCRPPKDFRPNLATIESVWRRVHAFLDDHEGLERSSHQGAAHE